MLVSIVFSRSLPSAICITLLTLFMAIGGTRPASAGVSLASLSGTVTHDRTPVAGSDVTLDGNNVERRAVTAADGRFAFAAIPVGTYRISAAYRGLTSSTIVDIGSGGTTVVLALGSIREIGSVTAVRAPAIRGSGADVSLGSGFLTRSPTSDNFSETLIQLPGAARGANGVVHLNGDHGVIDYVIDGVPIPQALNREIGSEIDPNDISFVDAVEGAYPAQYGLRFGSVLDITTRAGTGGAGFDGDVQYGSFGTIDQTLGYHAPLGAGGYDVAVRNQQTDRELDSPDFTSVHDRGSDANQFARITLAGKNGTYADVTAIHSYRSFGVPNDTIGGEPATTDDTETQDDTFLGVQFRRPLGHGGTLAFGPALKISHIRDGGDPANDWTYGEALEVAPAPFGNGGSSSDCANAIVTAQYAPTTCAFSLAGDKTSLDAIVQGEIEAHAGINDLRAGVAYDSTRVDKHYAVTLQPGNFLAPLVTPLAPASATAVVDNESNVGNTYQSYLQDSVRLTKTLQADAGMRYDFFTIRSSDFAEGFGAFSPRLKLTRFFGPHASLYAYAGRFFEPFSFENVAPRAAQLLNLPLQPQEARFDLKPERDTQLEFGGHAPLGTGELGFRIWQKNANDLIDDTQVGVTALHQDINYTLGRLSAETIDYELPLGRGGRAYLNLNHTVSLNAGCETQLLAPCFGQPTIFTPADHEQRYSVTSGFLANDRRGGWLSANMEYGSGLSSDVCMPQTDLCKATPHTIFAIEKGIAIGRNVALTARVANLFNDRYYVTLLNAQGTHVAPPRTFTAGLRFGR